MRTIIRQTATRTHKYSATREHSCATCDRCGTQLREDQHWDGYNKRTQIHSRAGYASLSGDGNKVDVRPGRRHRYALETFFGMQARRVYAPDQTPYAMAENIALTLREWIDSCFNLKWKRSPVSAHSTNAPAE